MAFWSGEKLEGELPKLITPFKKENLDCASYRLSAGEQAFVTTAELESQSSNVNLIKSLGHGSDNGAIRICPGQFAFLLTEEDVTVPDNAIAMISIRAGYKFKGLINVSGFHVDPGWVGKLIFSVYNAGPKVIIIRRGEPLFLIVYADLDRVSQKTYSGSAKHQKEISTKLVEDLTSVVFNPQALKNRVDEINEKLNTAENSRKHTNTWTTVAIGLWAIFVAAFVAVPSFMPGFTGALIANALNSAGYKLVAASVPPQPNTLPPLYTVPADDLKEKSYNDAPALVPPKKQTHYTEVHPAHTNKNSTSPSTKILPHRQNQTKNRTNMLNQIDLFSPAIIKDAIFSENREHRYFLSRVWDGTLKKIAFIGLNPSTADESLDDPTIRRCVGFAKSWGGGSLYMINLFAFRSTNPKGLLTASDPVGSENDHWISQIVNESDIVVAAWGNHGNFNSRDRQVLGLTNKKIYALSITNKNMPGHPLYLPKNSILLPFN